MYFYSPPFHFFKKQGKQQPPYRHMCLQFYWHFISLPRSERLWCFWSILHSRSSEFIVKDSTWRLLLIPKWEWSLWELCAQDMGGGYPWRLLYGRLLLQVFILCSLVILRWKQEHLLSRAPSPWSTVPSSPLLLSTAKRHLLFWVWQLFLPLEPQEFQRGCSKWLRAQALGGKGRGKH